MTIILPPFPCCCFTCCSKKILRLFTPTPLVGGQIIDTNTQVMDARQAKAILENYRSGKCSPEEKQLVEQWYAQLIETGEWQWSEGEREQLEQMMEARLLQQIHATGNIPIHRIPLLRTVRWWAAASVILVLGAGTYFMFFNKTDKNNFANLSQQQQQFKNDIPPAKQQVILTLSDGSTKILDSVLNGTVTLQGTTQAVKSDSSIAYLNNQGAEVVFNTITTKKGRIFHLQLADGTDVWLDALSSIRFPTSFPGSERVVEIIGQAYFEVAPSISKGGMKQPFKVKSGNQVIEVLGTHFNVNAHNQLHLQTTLLEGSVKLSSNSSTQSLFMRPGQQAQLNKAGEIVVTSNIDVDEVVAWKNGRFQFNSASLEEVMLQLVRWYDVQVEYKGKIPRSRFGGELSRNSNLSEVLKILEVSGVQFSIEGTTIVVKGTY